MQEVPPAVSTQPLLVYVYNNIILYFVWRNCSCSFSLKIVNPHISIYPTEEPIYMQSFNLTCVASLHPKVASQLIRYLVLEWVGPDGETLNNVDNGILVSDQQTFYDTATRLLIFNSLNLTHGGDYVCNAKLILEETFNATTLYHINILGKFL